MNCSLRGRCAALVVRLLALSLLVSACATTGSGQGSALERSIAGCSLAIGAGLLRDILHQNRPAAGTVLGVAVCGVLLALNNEEDKRRIAENQQAAALAGEARSASYVGPDGNHRTVTTTVREAQAPPQLASVAAPGGGRFIGPCRYTQTSIAAAQQGNATLDPELVCRTDRGDWPRWPGQAPA